MVIDNASKLISFLDGFDPSNKEHYKILNEIVKKYPHFYLVQPYFLKSIQQSQPEMFDQILSHTAIASYDRQLLYEFLETPKNEVKKETLKKAIKKTKKEDKKKKLKKRIIPQAEIAENEKIVPKKLPFSGWINYYKNNNTLEQHNKIDEKFKLFEAFLEKKRNITPKKEKISNDDLSKKSLASTDELMTETLAKVFVKQKKFENALQAYQVLSLKYPEKNSFFANQIKEIKRLQKLKHKDI